MTETWSLQQVPAGLPAHLCSNFAILSGRVVRQNERGNGSDCCPPKPVDMKRLFASIAVMLALGASAVYSKSLSHLNAPTTVGPDSSAELVIKSLRRLEDDVVVYRSLAAFEASGHLARVPLKAFERDL